MMMGSRHSARGGPTGTVVDPGTNERAAAVWMKAGADADSFDLEIAGVVTVTALAGSAVGSTDATEPVSLPSEEKRSNWSPLPRQVSDKKSTSSQYERR